MLTNLTGCLLRTSSQSFASSILCVYAIVCVNSVGLTHAHSQQACVKSVGSSTQSYTAYALSSHSLRMRIVACACHVHTMCILCYAHAYAVYAQSAHSLRMRIVACTQDMICACYLHMIIRMHIVYAFAQSAHSLCMRIVIVQSMHAHSRQVRYASTLQYRMRQLGRIHACTQSVGMRQIGRIVNACAQSYSLRIVCAQSTHAHRPYLHAMLCACYSHMLIRMCIVVCIRIVLHSLCIVCAQSTHAHSRQVCINSVGQYRMRQLGRIDACAQSVGMRQLGRIVNACAQSYSLRMLIGHICMCICMLCAHVMCMCILYAYYAIYVHDIRMRICMRMIFACEYAQSTHAHSHSLRIVYTCAQSVGMRQLGRIVCVNLVGLRFSLLGLAQADASSHLEFGVTSVRVL